MQKCSFDCLLLASFSVVISLSYFVRSISLVGKACKFPNRFLHPVSHWLSALTLSPCRRGWGCRGRGRSRRSQLLMWTSIVVGYRVETWILPRFRTGRTETHRCNGSYTVGVEVVAHVQTPRRHGLWARFVVVPHSGIEVCNYFRLEYTTSIRVY